MRVSRSTVIGTLAGLLVLGAIFGFVVGLPEATGDPGDAGEQAFTGELPALPDEIGNSVAISEVTVEDLSGVLEQQPDLDPAELEKQLTQLRTETRTGEKEAADILAEQYGAALVRGYLALENGAVVGQSSVTVVPGEPGLLAPNGPFVIDPKSESAQGSGYELKEIGGHRCSVETTAANPMTGATEPSYKVICRAAQAGLTYEIFSQGAEPEAVAKQLDELLEAVS